VQEKLLKKSEEQQAVGAKKRGLKGTSLSDQNSFALLDNEVIVSMACEMGVEISNSHFDTVEIMKDLELARHALNKVKKS
jgi:hypothetical protein